MISSLLNDKKFISRKREIFSPPVGNYRDISAATGNYLHPESSTEVLLLKFLA
jgi:hypothetical protein